MNDPWLRAILGAAVALGALFSGLGFLRESYPVLTNIHLFAPMIHGFAALAACCVSYLAFGRYKVSPDAISYWIGIAFATFFIAAIFYILTWPGMRADGQSILGIQPSTPSWIISYEMLFLGGLLLIADLAPSSGVRTDSSWGWSATTWLVLFTLIGILLIMFEGYLPALTGIDGTFTLLQSIFNWIFLLLFAAGVVLSLRRYMRTGEILPVYLAVLQMALVFTTIGTVMGGKRYTLTWYLGRFMVVVGFVFMLFSLLWEYVRLYRSEAEKTRQLNTIIAEQKQAQEDLKRLAEELKRSNYDLEQFAHIASHDLQEPLRVINGFLNLLKKRYGQQLDDNAREFIDCSVDGATRMSNLIKDLLEYSCVERKVKNLQPTDAQKALSRALVNLQGIIQETGSAVTQDTLPKIMVEMSQLTQIFQNLISNAIKFRHPDRRCQVHVSAKQRESIWVFAVRDNGIGIAPEQYERIFEIFQRLHGRDEYPGTGIGLSICKKIVERSGGKIWVESKVNEGSTFYFAIE